MTQAYDQLNKRIDDLIVGEVNKLLICSKCKNVYLSPVLNVSCGHTFCKYCYEIIFDAKNQENAVKCPVDSKQCLVQHLVLNRVLQDEINELQVRCKFNKGLTNLYDPRGCKQILKYGEKELHELQCPYSWVKCPNKNKCPLIRKLNLPRHLYVCQSGGRDETVPLPFDKVSFDTPGNLESYKPANSSQTNHPVSSCTILLELADELSNLSNKEILPRLEDIEHRLIQLEREFSKFKKESNQLELSPSTAELLDKVVLNETEATVSLSHPSDAKESSNKLQLSLRDAWKSPFQLNCTGTWTQGEEVTALVVADKGCVFSADSSGAVKLWSLENLTQGCKRKLNVSSHKVTCLAVNKLRLFVSGDDSCIRSYKIVTMDDDACVMNAHANSTKALACTEHLLFSSSYSVVKVWDCATLRQVQVVDHLKHWVRAMHMDASKLLTGSEGEVGVWDAGRTPINRLHSIKGDFGAVFSLTVTYDLIIIGTQRMNIYAYNIITLSLVHQFTGHLGPITCLVVSPNQKYMVSGSSDNSMLLWCLENKLLVQALQRHKGRVTCAGVYNEYLLSGSITSEIKIFQATPQKSNV